MVAGTTYLDITAPCSISSTTISFSNGNYLSAISGNLTVVTSHQIAFGVSYMNIDYAGGNMFMEFNTNGVNAELVIPNNGSKTFVIDHPLIAEKYLVHACLEGPEAGVYYRGTATIPAGANFAEITLPHYTQALATEFTVHVTPVILDDKAEFKSLAVSRVHAGKFKVYRKKTNKFWFMRKKTAPQQFDYLVFGKRAAIDIEPLKTEVEVKGQGPYKWI